METKDLLRLGTFIKNVVLTKKEYTAVVTNLGIDNYTDPKYVLDEVKHSTPATFYEILEQGKKFNKIQDCVCQFLSEESNNERIRSSM